MLCYPNYSLAADGPWAVGTESQPAAPRAQGPASQLHKGGLITQAGRRAGERLVEKVGILKSGVQYNLLIE